MEDTIRFGKVSNIDYAAGKMEIATKTGKTA